MTKPQWEIEFDERFNVFSDANFYSLQLTPREEKIYELRFRQHKTLEESGKELGVTRERIRQLEARVLEKIKKVTDIKQFISEQIEKERDRINYMYICTPEDYHPYECDGKGKCCHCDKLKTDKHNPETCVLCST